MLTGELASRLESDAGSVAAQGCDVGSVAAQGLLGPPSIRRSGSAETGTGGHYYYYYYYYYYYHYYVPALPSSRPMHMPPGSKTLGSSGVN